MNDEALAWAKEHTGQLITQLEDTTRSEVNRTITQGFAEGLTREEIADQLEDLYALSPERAQLIATTEAQMANGAGNVEGLRQAKEHGLNVKKEWVCDPDPCPECEQNDGVIVDVDDVFPSGDDSEPVHPSCMCLVNGVVIEDEEEDESDE